MGEKIPQVRLSNGMKIPVLGFGTYKMTEEKNAEDIARAIQMGYRMIDTAWMYENEKIVGRAIKECGIPRRELVIATKVWPNYYGTDDTRFSVERSLKDLGVDYLDLVYLHWPGKGYKESWRVLESLLEQGIARAIAVCNLREEHLEKLSTYANEKPVIDQIELHPQLQEKDLRAYLKKNDIQPVAYSPLARGKNGIYEEKAIQSAAKNHDRLPSQVILRWHIQESIIPIPKATSPDHQKKNLEVFDFSLTDREMADLEEADKNLRIGKLSTDEEQMKWYASRPK